MQKIKRIRRLCAIAAAVLFVSSVISLFMVFKDRRFSHLALWKIRDLGSAESFYWPPEKAPAGFYFDRDRERLVPFAGEISLHLKDRAGDLDRVCAIAGYVLNNIPAPSNRAEHIFWGSAQDLRAQIREGRQGAHCFHLSVLFSTYLASQGLPSRLWALENDCFDGIAHTVTEVYIAQLKKWVFFDIAQGFRVSERGRPLSFLEFRRRLRNNDTDGITIEPLDDSLFKPDGRLKTYAGLVKTVFLRTNNVFTDAFGAAGQLPAAEAAFLRLLPNQAFLGLRYMFGRDTFLHCVDKDSRALGPAAACAKAVLYFSIFCFVFSLAAGIYFVSAGLRNLTKKTKP